MSEKQKKIEELKLQIDFLKQELKDKELVLNSLLNLLQELNNEEQ